MKINNSLDAYKLIKDDFDTFQEKVFIIGVDTKNNFKYKKLIGMGGNNYSVIDPLVIFRDLLLNNCTKFFLFHNHPSKDLTPSTEDIEITKIINKQSKIMNIGFLDHIIFSDENHYSFFDNDEGGF